MRTQLTAAVLTGGLARRLQSLGDIDKGLVVLADKPLVTWAAEKLQPYTAYPLLISANRNQTQYAKYGQVVQDPKDLADYQGPLAGLLALLTAATTDWLMVLPVDSPFVLDQLVPDLWQAHLDQPTKQAFFAQHERNYPLCLLIHKDCAPALRAYLLSGQRKVQQWLAEQNAVAVDVRHYPEHSFFNINEPADIKSAQLRALIELKK